MTFSVVARDESGAIGMAVTSSSPAVAARCTHLRSQVGGVSSQNITDPRFGPFLLDELAAGATPRTALDKLSAADDTLPYRQITVVDARGRTAAHSGQHTLGVHNAVEGDGVVAAGNLLSSPQVPEKMLTAFTAADGELETRLLATLLAGEQAGGEAGEIRSCGLAVVRDAGWWVTDLRIDWHERPLNMLSELLGIWLPQRDNYVTRGMHPQEAPAYGVPGDP